MRLVRSPVAPNSTKIVASGRRCWTSALRIQVPPGWQRAAGRAGRVPAGPGLPGRSRSYATAGAGARPAGRGRWSGTVLGQLHRTEVDLRVHRERLAGRDVLRADLPVAVPDLHPLPAGRVVRGR